MEFLSRYVAKANVVLVNQLTSREGARTVDPYVFEVLHVRVPTHRQITTQPR